MQLSAFFNKKSMRAHVRFATMGHGAGSPETSRRLVALQQRKGAVSSRRGLPMRVGGKRGEEGSGLVDLLACHHTRELVSAIGARGVTCGERPGIPSVGSDVIEWQAPPLLIQGSQGRFRGRANLFPLKPLDTGNLR